MSAIPKCDCAKHFISNKINEVTEVCTSVYDLLPYNVSHEFSSNSLVITVKPKAKCMFGAVSTLLFTFY